MEHDFALIQWKNENCWDVVPLTDCLAVENDSESLLRFLSPETQPDLLGKEVQVKYNGELHVATVLEIAVERQLERKCQQLIKEYKERQQELNTRRVPVPNKMYFSSSECEEEEISQVLKSKLRKKNKSEKQENLLNNLKKKKIAVSQDRPCCTCKQLLEEANQRCVKLEAEIALLKTELNAHRQFKDALATVSELQKQAKSILQYSEHLPNPGSFTNSVEQIPICSNSQLTNEVNEKIELVPETGVYIEKEN